MVEYVNKPHSTSKKLSGSYETRASNDYETIIWAHGVCEYIIFQPKPTNIKMKSRCDPDLRSNFCF